MMDSDQPHDDESVATTGVTPRPSPAERSTPDPRTVCLAHIAHASASGWDALRASSFPGTVTIETTNSVYEFHDGLFVARSRNTPRGSVEGEPTDDAISMRDVRLIAFLSDEGGLWSFAARFHPGAHAVLYRPASETEPRRDSDPSTFLLTSRTTRMTMEEPQPVPWVGRSAPSTSGVFATAARGAARPPRAVRPKPPSMTRVHSAFPSTLR